MNDWKPGREDPHAVKTRVVGRVTFDVVRGEFDSFELVAEGVREVRTINNGRRELGA